MFFDSEVEIYYDLLKNDQILLQCTLYIYAFRLQLLLMNSFILKNHYNVKKEKRRGGTYTDGGKDGLKDGLKGGKDR